MSFTSSTLNQNIEAIDIRSTALKAFRDHLVLPIVDRVSQATTQVYLIFTKITCFHSSRYSSPTSPSLLLHILPSRHRNRGLRTTSAPTHGQPLLAACRWSAFSSAFKQTTNDRVPQKRWAKLSGRAWRSNWQNMPRMQCLSALQVACMAQPYIHMLPGQEGNLLRRQTRDLGGKAGVERTLQAAKPPFTREVGTKRPNRNLAAALAKE